MAFDLDLDKPMFLQADLLRLVPGLSAGTLQNWIARKVIAVDREEKPTKHSKVFWSSISVVAFRVMVEMTRLGLKPSQAFAISERLIQEIDSFLERFTPTPTDKGTLEFLIEGERMQDYRQFRVIQSSRTGELRILEVSTDAASEGLRRALFVQEYAMIVIELDILFGSALNAIERLRNGFDPATGELLAEPS